jgi:hypothetical protein
VVTRGLGSASRLGKAWGVEDGLPRRPPRSVPRAPACADVKRRGGLDLPEMDTVSLGNVARVVPGVFPVTWLGTGTACTGRHRPEPALRPRGLPQWVGCGRCAAAAAWQGAVLNGEPGAWLPSVEVRGSPSRGRWWRRRSWRRAGPWCDVGTDNSSVDCCSRARQRYLVDRSRVGEQCSGR